MARTFAAILNYEKRAHMRTAVGTLAICMVIRVRAGATMIVKHRLAATERSLVQRFDKLESSIEEASY